MMSATNQTNKKSNDYGALSSWSISRFQENFSFKPYAANQKNMCRICDRKEAGSFRYIQLNNPINNSWIVIDVDCDASSVDFYSSPEYYKYLEAPVPNIALKNPDNGHYQLIYAIDPVYTGPNARRKPQIFLDSIKKALINAIPFADPSFVGSKVISWNPLSDHWEKTEFHQGTYSLNELKEGIDEKHYLQLSFDFEPANEASYAMEGERNVSVFNSLRAKAYKNIKKSHDLMGYEEWLNELHREAAKINAEICDPPLKEREVREIAVSVGKFTWFRYTGNRRVRVMEFSEAMTAQEKQKASAKRTHEIIKENSCKAILSAVEVLFTSKEALTYASISRTSGRHRTTIYKYKEEIASKISELKESTKNDVVSGVHQVSVDLAPQKEKSLDNQSNESSIRSFPLRKIAFDQHISFEGVLYSVPGQIGNVVSVVARASHIEIYSSGNILLANHSRSYVRYSYKTERNHLSLTNRTNQVNRLLYWSSCIHPDVHRFCKQTLSSFIMPEQSFRRIQSILATFNSVAPEKLNGLLTRVDYELGNNWSAKKIRKVISKIDK